MPTTAGGLEFTNDSKESSHSQLMHVLLRPISHTSYPTTKLSPQIELHCSVV